MSRTEEWFEGLEVRALLNAGALETSFATKGEFSSGFGAHAVFNDVAVQADGRIVAVGTVNPEAKHPKVLVARFTADGKLDKGFSGDGFDVSTLKGFGTRAFNVLLTADGKVFVSGAGPNSSGFIARYRSDGTLDKTFSTDGIVQCAGGAITDFAFGPNDTLVAVNAHTVFRYHSFKGNLDGTFGGSGRVALTLSDQPFFQASNVAVGSDGQVVVAGSTRNDQTFTGDVIALRLKSNGAFDKTFGDQGIVDEYVAGDDAAFGVAILPDKKILIESGGEVGNNELIVLDKNGHDIGQPFDNQHTVSFDFSSGNYSSFGGFISDYVRRSDGSFFAVGEADDEANNPFVVVDRLRSNFSPDSKFGIGGSSIAFPGVPEAIALTPQGDVIVVGATTFFETPDSSIPSGKALILKLKSH